MHPSESAYDPRVYWGARISGNGSLANVGQVALGSYNKYAYPLRLEALSRALRGWVAPGCRVFDGGFGEGVYLAYWAARHVGTVAGLDYSERAVEAGQLKHPDYDLRCGDLSRAEDLAGFGRFDVVTAVDVLYHIVDDGAWACAVGNLLQLVDNDGVFVFSDKFPAVGAHQPVAHVRRRSLARWTAVLAAHGFAPVRRVPVFVLMDDPITCGSHRWLGHLSRLQWRAATKLIRMAGSAPRLQNAVAALLAGLQQIPERLLVRALSESPNLELVVCRRMRREPSHYDISGWLRSLRASAAPSKVDWPESA